MKRIYLDHAAATPLDESVLHEMLPYLTSEYGNPSSLHYFGQKSRSAVQQARTQVARELGVSPEDVVFTSGGTEADNLAILGYLRANYPNGGHIITSSVEHHAVLRTFEAMAQKGYDVTFLPVEADGRISVEVARAAIRPDTVLLSCMFANNETGMVQPIEELGALLKEQDIAFHVDAVQAFGYVPIHPIEQHIDLLTFCGHKIYGPKGIGALYVRHGLKVASEAYGGPQEHRLRAGTENVPAIVGFGKAVALLHRKRRERAEKARSLKQYLYDHLIKGNDTFHLNGTLDRSLPNIIDFSVRGWNSAILLIALDKAGIAVSAGSACEAGAVEPSHVLKAMGLDETWLTSSIRISFGESNTIEEVDAVIKTLQNIVG